MRRMNPDIITRRIESFEKRFGKAHLYLASHAAFPVALTPDLLYRLWTNFQQDIHGEVLDIPWIAVADLLLSNLCDEVGHELYEMDVTTRKVLLKQLKEDEKFGQQRINELSDFLLVYILPQLQSDDLDLRDLAQAHLFTALAQSHPEQAARELALAFSKIDQKDIAEMLRISSLVETLAEQLSKFQTLLAYSRAIANFARGKLEDAKVQLIELVEQEPQIKISGVSLPTPKPIQANLTTFSTSLNQFRLAKPDFKVFTISLPIPKGININLLTFSSVSRFSLPRLGIAMIFALGVLHPVYSYSLLPSRQTSSPPTESKLLQVGSWGSEVTSLQHNLRRLGFYNNMVTGYFGSKTQQAVIRFQQSSGIRADGIVDSRTQQAIIASLDRNPNGIGGDSLPNALTEGDAGNEVTQLQKALQQLRYFNLNLTGYFGSSTKDAVARFQRDNELVANGIADSRTLATISRALASVNPGCVANRGDICFGENNQRVVAVQQRLRDWGFLTGNVDGLYGSETRDAIAQFQKYYGLNPTGFVDFPTWQALKLENNGGQTAGNPTPQNRYVVVVPISNQDTLNIVRQYVRNAFAAQSRLGDYVNAGAFSDRADAEKLSKQLRARGLDARVDYF